jgi:radical SAM protein with 4Fe4S-binding SPASM domain
VSRDTIRDEYDELLKQADIGFGNKVRLPYCTAPFTGGIIFANGGYIPCCYVDKDVSFGSIARTSFERIWNSPGLQKLRRSMFDDSLLIPTCHNCNARQRYIFTTQLLQVIHRLGYRWEDIEFSTNFNPPVVVKAQIDALRDEFFAPGTCYSLGTPIKFGTEGNARPFMSAGFSVPGPSSVWNDGFESFLSFNVTSEASSSLVFEVSLLPFLHSDLLPQQRVEVFVNGRYIDSWCLKRPVISRCHVTVEEPLVGADGRVQFAFRFPDASSWYHLGVNKSKGSRSVMFIEARLYDASAQEEIK